MAETTGLENRQPPKGARGFESLPLRCSIALIPLAAALPAETMLRGMPSRSRDSGRLAGISTSPLDGRGKFWEGPDEEVEGSQSAHWW